jgi:hypothetical protein
MAAIYQWFEGIVEVQIWTTTLYPLETADALKFDVDINVASLDAIESEYIELGMTLLSMDVVPTLISGSMDDDYLELGMTLISLDVELILITGSMDEDFLELGMTLVDMDVIPKLITIYSPDQGLIMDVDLDTANCSLDAV